jgi:GNAT superfamily N-acetyltransferase
MTGIVNVTAKKQLKAFIDFPHELYKGDNNYVPELFIAQRDLLTPGKHPFHEHSKMQLFLYYKDHVIAGRMAAILNNNHNRFNNTTDGFFGFFECINDMEAASALFTSAEQWLKEQGATTIIGPVNPSTNEPCGLLIDGFDKPPIAMMTYNKPYYTSLLEMLSLQKKVDLLAWDLSLESVGKRPVMLEERLLNRLRQNGITIRAVNKKDLANEANKVREVYNAAWDKNLGFVPMTDNEFSYLAKDLKMVLDEELCLIAEHNGKQIGFALAIPDINQILIKVRRGRLLPTGIFKLLLNMKKIDRIRVLALGVNKEYRKMGIEACFYAAIIKRVSERRMKGAEASWILEHNEMMNKGIESINGKVYKRYRIYEKPIQTAIANSES